MAVEAPNPSEAIAEAMAAREAGMQQAEDADRTGWDRHVIDQAINAFAARGVPFSANDFRHLIGDVRPALIGRRFSIAAREGRIRYVGRTTSTKKNTHAKDVAQWIGVPQ